ncbi:MAG: hypothetical protein ACO3RT_06840, partial [Arenicellales bacterium]
IDELPRLDEERQLAEIAKDLGIDMPESLRISEPRQGDEERSDAGSDDMDLDSDSEDSSGAIQRHLSPEVDVTERVESETDQEASKVAST